ncbi:IS110 family transposase [Defluviimonas sp. WL0075]|uniref:IS110 family transposase n=1 Tax=Albidovulum sediminicola TaxID=2984331 RepID=A0ABT2Z6R6_9RHOB|nr:IS110 family transposase [Defluviimonas sp. WL0075]MCV2866834.1 IS110 family transposase [Defluviimonas sp. WL0075]
MSEVTIIGIDLAKRSFQLHGADRDGSVVFRKRLSRGQLLGFVSQVPRCVIAMEACATAHGWGREFAKLGHEVRLIPPVYVKPFVKRQKNDSADAEAIVEAALRPTMRFVTLKTEDQQARAMLFRTRQMFVGQRTQLINALRGHLAEHGLIAARGPAHLKRLADAIEDGDTALPTEVRELGQLYLEQIECLNARIAELDGKMRHAAKDAEVARRAQTMPGVGPITALAIETFAPDLAGFRRGRDFAAWLGLVPKQHSTGGKARLGRTSKMGQRDIRTLLVSGAMAVLQAVERFDIPNNGWLKRLLTRKPRMVAAIALANKMARALWAMLTKQENYRNPAAELV